MRDINSNFELAKRDSQLTGIAYFIFLLLFVAFSSANGKPVPGSYKVNERTNIYTTEGGSDSVYLQMDNDLSVPVSIKLSLDPKNLDTKGMNQMTVVVPARTTGFVVNRYRKQFSDSIYSLSYTWKIVLGDVTKTPDNGAIYSLPFSKDKSFKISQGPNGAFSHNDMFAYDFEMPFGTPILAARDGIVALIKSDSNKGGPSRQYINDANFVSIYHSDGSIANYIHLKAKGIIVSEGQVVKKGDVIGYSGNTGFSSGPHLHFEINQPQIDSSINKTVAFNWEPKSYNFFAALYHKALNYSKYIWGN